MATIQQRYEAATGYVSRAVLVVEEGPSAYDPISGLIEWYAGRKKTEAARGELSRIQDRWMRATNELERARVARDAELLADRVKENLPGAPQDWKRTNLVKGEKETHAPATSYAGEVHEQAAAAWGWARETAGGVAQAASGVGKLVLIGGGALLAWKAVGLLRARQRRNVRASRERLSVALERAAGGRAMCPICHRYHQLDERGRFHPHEYPSGGMCPGGGMWPLLKGRTR